MNHIHTKNSLIQSSIIILLLCANIVFAQEQERLFNFEIAEESYAQTWTAIVLSDYSKSQVENEEIELLYSLNNTSWKPIVFRDLDQATNNFQVLTAYIQLEEEKSDQRIWIKTKQGRSYLLHTKVMKPIVEDPTPVISTQHTHYNIIAYPNPAKYYIYLELPHEFRKYQFKMMEIRNLEGSVAERYAISPDHYVMKVDVSQLEEGQHIIRLISKEISVNTSFKKIK